MSLSDDKTSPERLHGGEISARQRLEGWMARLKGYAEGRDRLDRDATSRLSQDLKFGTLSPGQVIAAVEGTGTDKWKVHH